MSAIPYFKVAATVISRTGLGALCAPFTAGMGMIFTLHRVQPPGPDTGFHPNRHLSVTPDFLDRVLGRVRERGYDVVDLAEAVRRVRAGRSARPFCCFTFDDGYRDNLDHALPVFRRHGAPMTLFACTGVIDGTALLWWEVVERILAAHDRVEFDAGDARWTMDTSDPAGKCAAARRITEHFQALPSEQEARARIRAFAARYGLDCDALCRELGADWSELRRAVRDPLVRLGAHTVTHPTLARLGEAEVRAEIEGGIDRLESELGVRVAHFAYPYGFRRACGRREFDIAGAMGLEAAVTTRPGVLTASHAGSLTALPRVSLNGHYQSLSMLDALLSGLPLFVGNGFRRAGAFA